MSRRVPWPARWSWMVPGIALLVAFGLPGCGGSSDSTTTAKPAESPAITTRAVAIGNGRRIELQCRGAGLPTVVLISGTAGAWDDWTNVGDPAAGKPKPSPSAVFPQVARVTRVCGYDRPGVTTLDGKPTRTTLVRQPTTAQGDVADLRALLTAAGVPAPYVLVGQSWGGLVAQLYARRYPAEVKGLVLVDPANQYLRFTLSPEQWRRFLAAGMKLNDGSGAEVPDHARSVGVVAAARTVATHPDGRPHCRPSLRLRRWARHVAGLGRLPSPPNPGSPRTAPHADQQRPRHPDVPARPRQSRDPQRGRRRSRRAPRSNGNRDL